MKKNKPQKVDEGFLDALIGDQGAAGLKSMFKKGMTKQAQLAQDLFLKDFIGDAVASLQAGIRGGFIDPSITGGTTAASSAPADSMAVKTAKSRTGTQPAGNPAAAATTATPAAPAAATPAATPAKPAPAVQKMAPKDLNAAKAQNKVAPGTATGAAPTQRMTPRDRLMLQRQAKAVKEGDTYTRLNSLFESIMEANGGQSIAAYMTGWFNKYMGGVDWQANKATLQPLIQNIEATYRKDKGYKAIRQLAQAAFAVAKTSGVTPAGAENIPGAGGASTGAASTSTAATAAPAGAGAATPGQAPKITAKDINQVIPNLTLKQLEALKKTIDAFIVAKTKTPAAGAAPAAAAPTPTSESRYRR